MLDSIFTNDLHFTRLNKWAYCIFLYGSLSILWLMAVICTAFASCIHPFWTMSDQNFILNTSDLGEAMHISMNIVPFLVEIFYLKYPRATLLSSWLHLGLMGFLWSCHPLFSLLWFQLITSTMLQESFILIPKHRN